MLFHLDNSPKLRNALINSAPLVLCSIAGSLLGLSYLALSGSLFLTLSAFALFLIMVFKDFRYGYFFILLILPVDRVHIAVSLPKISIYVYQVWIFPYVVPLLITVMAWMVSRAWKSDRPGRTTPVSGLLLFMVAYILISLIWAPDFELGYLLALSLVVNYSVFSLTRAVIIDEATLRRAANFWVGMGSLAAIGAIVSQWYSYTYSTWLSSRLKLEVVFDELNKRPAGFGGTDFVAGLMVSSIFITVGLIMASNGFVKKKLFLYFLVFIQIVAVIETLSRGALIGLIAGFILLFIIHPAAKNKVLKYSFLAIFFFGVIILIAKPSYIDRIIIGFGYTGELYFSEKSFTGNTDVSKTDVSGLAGRARWWKIAFKEMTNRPYKLFLGLGIGGFTTYTGAYYTHSVPLSFFFDMGLIGALIFISLALILFTNFALYLKHAKHTSSYFIFMASVVAFVAEIGVHGLIDWDFYSYAARLFWFPLAYVCATLNVMMAENPELVWGGA